MWKIPSFVLFLVLISAFPLTIRSDLIISKLDRTVDLTSHIVRAVSSVKVENDGPGPASEVLLAIPNIQAKNLAYLKAIYTEGKGKGKGSSIDLPVEVSSPKGMPAELTFYSVSLPKELKKGASFTFIVLSIFTRSLVPFPEKITQDDTQLVVYQDSAYHLSPYYVKSQTLSIRLPSKRVESYTTHPNGKLVDSEVKYGPYNNIPAFSYSPIVVHFENNNPFAVSHELLREIEISHWGNVQVTEHYTLVHGGAQNKGGFSRLDYQSRMSGVSSIRNLVAGLPPRAHSVYYRDEIGNISTSHLWGDSKQTQLAIEPRFPIFGGWKTFFTIGYGLPLEDFLFNSEGKRFLNITFGSPFSEIVIDNIIVKVVLPEGSKEISVSTPFPTVQRREVKLSHLDISGRPVVVLEKSNVVPEHNQYFQVYYKFNNISLLREPLMLICGFFFLFITCIVYMHSDMSISKSSASYLARLHLEEVQEKVQQVQNIINKCLVVHDKLEASLHELSRTGDVQTCKLARKTADGLLKESAKELKPLLMYLQSSPQASHIWPKVEELVAKEKEMQEKMIAKHTAVVDCFEKKLKGKEVENRVAAYQQKLAALREDVDELLKIIDEFC